MNDKLLENIYTLKEKFFTLCKDGTNVAFSKDKNNAKPNYYTLDSILIECKTIIHGKKLDLSLKFISENDYLKLVFFNKAGIEKIISSERFPTYCEFHKQDIELIQNKAIGLDYNNKPKINTVQAYGKTKTYFKRYMLLDFLCLVDSADDDATSLTREIVHEEKKAKEKSITDKITEILVNKGYKEKENRTKYLLKDHKVMYDNKNYAKILEELQNGKPMLCR